MVLLVNGLMKENNIIPLLSFRIILLVGLFSIYACYFDDLFFKQKNVGKVTKR